MLILVKAALLERLHQELLQHTERTLSMLCTDNLQIYRVKTCGTPLMHL